MPFAKSADLWLLGRTPRGWLIRRGAGDATFFIVRPGGLEVGQPRREARHRVHLAGNWEGTTYWRLGGGGHRFLEWDPDRDGGVTYARIFSTSGRRLAERTFPSYGTVLAFGRHGLLATLLSGRTVRWVPGRGTETIVGRASNFASSRWDLLSTSTGRGRYGPTSLSAPTEPLWSARFRPMRVSPNGRLLVGRATGTYARTNLPGAIQVRRVSDGAVLVSIQARYLRSSKIWWESNRAILFQMSGRRGTAIVRCTLDAKCQRATKFVKAPGFEYGAPGELGPNAFTIPFEAATPFGASD
jgi:hypothetical protein